jgi:hypothetical protein
MRLLNVEEENDKVFAHVRKIRDMVLQIHTMVKGGSMASEPY